jgi:tRNA (cytidine32/uridine32-2'-O)-methyltransferase
MPSTTNLHNISIVLVDTKTPANIGATARCMMNMGLPHLVLVRPPKDPLHEAVKLAAGADTVLDRSQVVATLKEAVVDHGLVFGTSRHKGRLRKNIRTPRDAAKEIIPFLSRNKVAIVFGNEVNGLTREDLALCSDIMAIPSSDSFPSLNLSHAVMIIAYELFLASRERVLPDPKELAPSKFAEDFYQHLEKTLLDIEFLDQDKPERMMFTLRQLFGRSRLGRRDVAVLRGILSAVERAARLSERK